MESTLKQWPPSSTNNARAIMRKKLEKMRDFPSEQRAEELQRLGVVCDFQSSDMGEPPASYQDNQE